MKVIWWELKSAKALDVAKEFVPDVWCLEYG